MNQTPRTTDEQTSKPAQQLRITAQNLLYCARYEPDARSAAAIGAAAAAAAAVHACLEADLLAFGPVGARPAAVPDFAPIQVGELRIERRSRSAYIGQNPVRLTAIEFDLLCVLATDPTPVFTKPEIYRAVYQHEMPSQRAQTLTAICTAPQGPPGTTVGAEFPGPRVQSPAADGNATGGVVMTTEPKSFSMVDESKFNHWGKGERPTIRPEWLVERQVTS